MTARSRSRRCAVAGVAVAVALGLSACGSSDSSGDAAGTPTTTVAPPGSAQIVTFDVPATLACAGKPSVTFTVNYATKGAKNQTLIVDGRAGAPVTAPSGTIEAPVHCDNLKHTIVLAAYDDKGRLTSQAKYLDTNVDAPS